MGPYGFQMAYVNYLLQPVAEGITSPPRPSRQFESA